MIQIRGVDFFLGFLIYMNAMENKNNDAKTIKRITCLTGKQEKKIELINNLDQ